MKKYFLTLVFQFLVIIITYSQSDNTYSLYQYNTNIINPAYAGSHETLDIGIMRNWSYVRLFNIDSYKRDGNLTANIHSPISKGFGVGFSFEEANLGPIKEKDYSFDLSYKYKIADEASLAVGLKIGENNLEIKLIDFQADEYVKNFLSKNIGSGIYFQKKKLYTGVAYSYFFGESLVAENAGLVIDDNYSMHMVNGFFGFLVDLSTSIKLKPTMKVVYSSALNDTWFFISGNVFLDKVLELGVHYNFSSAVAFSLNTPLLFNTLKLGLNVDLVKKGNLYFQSYQNLTLIANFYINAFGKKSEKRYF